MTVIVTISMILFILGAFLMFLAGLGLLRLPDIFLRMSAATKASTLGAGFILLAAALYFDDLGTTSRAIATIFFLLLTGPVAAHRIARAAYFDGAPLWEGTLRDDLRGHYDQYTHELESDPCDDFPPEDCEDANRDMIPA
ncbi:monovalent cation/H(+) antiporter subunit G [Chloroflexota bacterium]